MKLKMLCTCGAQSSDTSPILDVEKVLQDYAWREFRHLTPWLSGVLIRRNDYVMDVQWNFFEMEHKTTMFEPRPDTKDGFTEKKTVELFGTNFKNDTGVSQTYRFKIQRQTKATTSVTYQRGFTIKESASFKLSIPAALGDCGVSAGVDGQLNITKSAGETFEEVFTWETDNEVTVEKNHVTYARMLLTEDEMVADFEVETTLKMPSGQAPIVIRRRRDNEIQAVCLINNLKEVFASYEEDQTVESVRVKVGPNEIRHDIKLITTGVIRSLRWRDQKICLQSRPLPQAAAPQNDTKPILDLPTDDLVDLNAKEIYAHVIRHVTGRTNEDKSAEDVLEIIKPSPALSAGAPTVHVNPKVSMSPINPKSSLNPVNPKVHVNPVTTTPALAPSSTPPRVSSALKGTPAPLVSITTKPSVAHASPTGPLVPVAPVASPSCATPPLSKAASLGSAPLPSSGPLLPAITGPPRSPVTSASPHKETRLIKFPTIPTIVTEGLPDHGKHEVPHTNGAASPNIPASSTDTTVVKRRTADDKPKLERGIPCVDGSSPPGDHSPKTTLSTLQARRAKLAKVTSV